LAYDPEAKVLFVADNGYQRGKRDAFIPQLARLEGVGRVWSVTLDDGSTRPVTALSVRRTTLPFLRSLVACDTEDDALLTEIHGVLRWPTSLALEPTGRTLLVTEAKRLSRIDFQEGTLSHPYHVDMCFNLIGVAHTSRGIIISDAGVYPRGFGRLMELIPGSPYARSVREGLSFVAPVAAAADGGMLIVAHGGAWPKGRVELFEINDLRAPLRCWHGLDLPSHAAVHPRGEGILLCTAEGLVLLNTLGLKIW
jgi:hypothetical protein